MVDNTCYTFQRFITDVFEKIDAADKGAVLGAGISETTGSAKCIVIASESRLSDAFRKQVGNSYGGLPIVYTTDINEQLENNEGP